MTIARARDDRSLHAENAELRAKLAEAEDLLRAIRSGDLDALLVESDSGPRVFTLQGLDAESSRMRGEMLECVSDAVITLDRDEIVTFANLAAQRLFGLGASSALGKRLSEVAELQLLGSLMDDRDSGVSERRVETMFIGADGDQHALEATITDARASTAERGGVLAIFRDISARKRAEAALEATNRQLESLLSHAPLGMAYFDRHHRYVRINEDLAAINGIPVADHIGRTIEELLPVNADKVVSVLDRIFDTGEAVGDLEVMGGTPRESGDNRYWRTGFYPVLDAGGAVALVGTWVAEITERKRVEEAVRENEARLRAFLEHGAVIAWLKDEDGRHLFLSPNFERRFGVRLEDWKGKTDFELWPHAIAEQFQQNHRAVLAAEAPIEVIESAPNADGTISFWLYNKFTVRDAAGKRYVGGLGVDITERKLAEAAQRETEERLRLATDAAGIGIWVLDPEQDRIVWENDWPNKLLRLGADDKPITVAGFGAEFVHPDDRSAFAQTVASARQGGAAFIFEGRFRCTDGQIRWVQLRGKQVPLEGVTKARLLGAARDITERKQQEDHIQLLLREVTHRAKNMLSVVQAIARYTATSSPGDFVERFSQRIQALAASLDLLVSSNWQGADLDALVRCQLAHFKDLLETRIEVRGEPLQISSAAAQTLGMALHELATNAAKYGALAKATGRVAIAWGTTRSGRGDERFTISWTERGGPPVTVPARRGFGTAVIDGMAKIGLNAEVQVNFLPAGFEWHLDCSVDQMRGAGSYGR